MGRLQQLRDLVADSLGLWGIAADVGVDQDRVSIRPVDGAVLLLERHDTGWVVRRVSETLPSDLLPAHPSVLGLLRELRAELAPDHRPARLVIAPAPVLPGP